MVRFWKKRFTLYKDTQKRIALNSNSTSSWSKYIKTLLNKVNNLRKYAKQNVFSNLENDIEQLSLGNNKGCWKALKELQNTRHHSNFKAKY